MSRKLCQFLIRLFLTVMCSWNGVRPNRIGLGQKTVNFRTCQNNSHDFFFFTKKQAAKEYCSNDLLFTGPV